MKNLRVGSWVKYKLKQHNSGDPFSPSIEEREVYAVVIQVDRNNCVITWYEDVDGVPTFKTMLTSINSVEVIFPYSSTCCEEVKECTKKSVVSPVERALDMVSDYCVEKVRNFFFGTGDVSEEYLDKSGAYLDVRNFIQDCIKRHKTDWENQKEETHSVDESQ